MVVNKPNLFIVGAPKCGTSFMYEFLAAHPQVFMCPNKEPNYFDKDLNYLSPRLTQSQYLSLFNQVTNEKIIGEASTWYLYSSVAANEIYNFNPEAKIIIMLRNPIDFMHSLHSENLYQGNESIENFEEALLLEDNRKNNININPHSNPKEVVFYKSNAKYTEQIKRYIEKFGSNNVHIIILDDLKSNAEKVCSEVLKFLVVDNISPSTLNSVNPNKQVKNKRLRDLIIRPPSFFRNVIRILIPIHSVRIYIQQKLKGLNTKKVKREALNDDLTIRLKIEFAQEIEQLSKLLNRDLSDWLKDKN